MVVRVPVLWISRYNDILARSYADEGLIECLFDLTLWRPPRAFTFEHYEPVGRPGTELENFPDVDGAVICLPARHHTSREDVDWLKEQIDRLQWSVLMFCGDEEGSFPFAEFPQSGCHVRYVMQPRPEHAHLRTIPGGWYPQTQELLRDTEHHSRVIDFYFAGQVVDNTRRHQLMKVLQRLPRGHVHQTQGYMQGMPKAQYFRLMAQSKVVPSPSGPMTVDTSRTYEALEAGCVPIVDSVTPRGENYDFWTLLFGPDHPLKSVTDWKEFPELLQAALRDWPVNSNRHFSFWQQHKRKLAHQIHDDIRTVRENASYLDVSPGTADDLVTVVISTSPAPLHPSTDHILQVIDSVRARLPHAEILIACDGVRHEDGKLNDVYNHYLSHLLWAANYSYDNVLPILMPEFLHQANSVKRVLEMVKTPYVLFLEHDTPLEGDIPFLDMCNALSTDHVSSIRLHFDVELHSDHEPLHFGTIAKVFNIPLRRIRVWWARPFLTKLDNFRELLDTHFNDESRTFIEDKLYGVLHCDWEDNRGAAWGRWKIWTYMPEGSIKRSGHLDSRGANPKWGLKF